MLIQIIKLNIQYITYKPNKGSTKRTTKKQNITERKQGRCRETPSEACFKSILCITISKHTFKFVAYKMGNFACYQWLRKLCTHQANHCLRRNRSKLSSNTLQENKIYYGRTHAQEISFSVLKYSRVNLVGNHKRRDIEQRANK